MQCSLYSSHLSQFIINQKQIKITIKITDASCLVLPQATNNHITVIQDTHALKYYVIEPVNEENTHTVN